MCVGVESQEVSTLAKEGSLAEEETETLLPAARLEAALQPCKKLNCFSVCKRVFWMLEEH